MAVPASAAPTAPQSRPIMIEPLPMPSPLDGMG